ncbi:MAG TPA: hypothetical protein VLC55_01565 [Burkholderiales bacterium]|nr:hypothetical protein [Burkholderiales bacterium]
MARLVIVGLMTVAAYSREREAPADPGTTTVVAIVLCYGLGAMIWYGYATLALMLAIIANIVFRLALVAAIGGPALAERCAPAMLACAAGLGAGLLLIRGAAFPGV